jgi:diacylglycerol kinase (ATP)
MIPLLVQMVNGIHVNHPKIEYFQTAALRISTPQEEPVTIDLDGEMGGALPVQISVAPAALHLIVP